MVNNKQPLATNHGEWLLCIGGHKMRKLLSIITLLCICSNTIVFANNNLYLTIANDTKYNLIMDIKAENVIINTQNNIEFSNSDNSDSNTYVISEKTIFSNIPTDGPDLQWFLDGRAQYISVVIPKTDYFKYSKKSNKKINVVAVGGFYSRLEGVGTQKQEENEFGFIFAFNIMQTDGYGNFDREYITRAEMAQILVNILHLRTAETMTEESLFSDIDKNHWAYNSIHICKEAGIIDGYRNGMFGPEDRATYEQVIKLLVTVLGYSTVAEENGSYPQGYIKVANDIGILKGIDVVPTNDAKRENVARMILNLVYLPVMEQTVYGENPEYQIMDGNNGMPLIRFFDKYFVSNAD